MLHCCVHAASIAPPEQTARSERHRGSGLRFREQLCLLIDTRGFVPMPHIDLSPNLPGISAAFAFRPDTAAPMRELAHILLFESGQTTSLNSRDRELIAAYVSSLNNCYFCHQSHAAAAAHHTGGSNELVSSVCENPRAADISPKLRALLAISARIQSAPKGVTPELVEAARAQGATD